MNQQLSHRGNCFAPPIASLGLAALLVGCSGAPNSDQAQAPVASNSAAQPSGSQATRSQSFPNPVVSPTAIVEVPAVPGLLQSTNARVRVPTITTGRSDPFAVLATGPVTLPAASTVTKARTQPAATSSSKLPPFSLAPLPSVPANSPQLTPLPSLPNSAALPPAAIPVAPPSRTALADSIDISGVVQVKGQWHVIVKEPNSNTSRYVTAGDYLANGSVLVKKIITGAGADPIVVLQQNGVEVTKSIGAKGPIASR